MLHINKRKIGAFDSAKTAWKKGIGLMFKSKVEKPLIFFFNREWKRALHMWFVFTPIDVLFLNKKKEIVEIKKDFKPFQYYTPQEKAQYIIELAPKSVTKFAIKVGQKASF